MVFRYLDKGSTVEQSVPTALHTLAEATTRDKILDGRHLALNGLKLRFTRRGKGWDSTQ